MRDPGANGVHDANHFMAGHARILQAGPVTILDQRIAVADAAGLDLDSHPPRAGRGDFTFNHFQRPVRARNLYGTHFWHDQLLVFRPPIRERGRI